MTVATKPVSIIVAALLPHFGIGYNGGLPWRLVNELKYFRRVTVGDESHSNAVIMGRKTWESIPAKFRPLPNRLNVVITRNKAAQPESTELLFHSVRDALAALQENPAVKKIFVIGGQQIYKETLPLVNSLLLTEITASSEHEPIKIDTYFDRQYVQDHFKRVSNGELQAHIGFETETAHTENGLNYEYTLYKRLE
jgi:dihydrofolate reductase